MQKSVDPAKTLIEARWVLPVEPDGALLPDHAVVVNGSVIEAVVPIHEARERFPASERVALTDHMLVPGLVNLHTHAAMTLLRGLADDLPLMAWLKDHIWPAEIKHASDRFVHDGTLIACAEMIRGGVTCFNDMYFYPEAAARAALEAGMRAALGIIVIEFPTAYASDPQDYLAKGLAVRDEFRHEPLLSFCMAPHAPYTVSDRSLAQVLTLAEQLDVPIHLHLHETDDEIAQEISRARIASAAPAAVPRPARPEPHRCPCHPRRRTGDRIARATRLPRRPLPFVEPQARERLCTGSAIPRCRRQRRPRYGRGCQQ